MLTDDEHNELRRQLQVAEIMAAVGPFGPITPDEAALYEITPEEVEAWNAEDATEAHAQTEVRFSLLKKLAAVVEMEPTVSVQALCDLGNLLGPPGHPQRELLVRAAYDLQVLANVADRMLPPDTRRAVAEAIERWRTR